MAVGDERCAQSSSRPPGARSGWDAGEASRAMPLPRCVLSRAPAATAARMVGTVGGRVSQGDRPRRAAVASADELDRAGPLGGQRDQDDPAVRDASWSSWNRPQSGSRIAAGGWAPR